jgi:hypothetical protein
MVVTAGTVAAVMFGAAMRSRGEARMADDLAGFGRDFEHVVREHPRDAPALANAAGQFAREARAAGVPPERMLVALGEVLNTGALGSVGDWWRRVVRDQCVRRAIEAYYAIEVGQPKPSILDSGEPGLGPTDVAAGDA